MAWNRILKNYEMMAAVVAVLILIGIGLQQMTAMMARVERLEFNRAVSSMRTGLHYFVVMHLGGQQQEELIALSQGNPVGNIVSEPRGYLGELKNSRLKEIIEGSWWFDAADRKLCYRIINTEAFAGSHSTRRDRCFKLQLVYQDNDNNGFYTDGERVTGVKLSEQGL